MQLKLPTLPLKVIQYMQQSGYECYAVGGGVRDLLLGKSPTDWDFTTNATPEQILKIFPDGFYDNNFGTVGIPVEDLSKPLKFKLDKSEKEKVVEITTYRTESEYKDNRRPEKVEWGKSLNEDLKRRDFTINAIATDSIELFDPYNGQHDLRNKLIRAVGNPDERFKEDALRMMRAVRLATQLEFLVEEKTRAAIENDKELLKKIATERIRDELLYLLKADNPADGILLLKHTGLLEYILPELLKAFDVEQKSPQRHHIYDVGTHCVETLRYCPNPDPYIRLAALLHDIGKVKTVAKDKSGITTFYNHEVAGASMIRLIAKRLRLSKKNTGLLIRLVRWHQFSMDDQISDKAIRRFIRNIGIDNIQAMLDLRVGDRKGSGAKESSWRFELFRKRLDEIQATPFSIHDLKVDGNDVIKILNIKPSKKVGEVLETIFEKVDNDELPNEREKLLEQIKSLTPTPGVG